MSFPSECKRVGDRRPVRMPCTRVNRSTIGPKRAESPGFQNRFAGRAHRETARAREKSRRLRRGPKIHRAKNELRATIPNNLRIIWKEIPTKTRDNLVRYMASWHVTWSSVQDFAEIVFHYARLVPAVASLFSSGRPWVMGVRRTVLYLPRARDMQESN